MNFYESMFKQLNKLSLNESAVDGEIKGKYVDLGVHDSWHVYQPLDYIAAMDLGVNTGWWTAGRGDHAGHPRYKPSETEAKHEFNSLVSGAGNKLYYFLNKNTMYGEYAIILYPSMQSYEDEYNNRYSEDTDELREYKFNYSLYNFKGDEEKSDNKNIIEVAKKLDIPVWQGYVVTKLEDGIQYEGDKLVKCYSQEPEITIKPSTKIIGWGAFHNCEMKYIHIPNSVTNIDDDAFSGCTNLIDIKLPDNITNIGGSTFSRCRSLENITIPISVKTIEMWAFKNCSSLTNIIIPNNVTSIGVEAFNACKSLKSVIIGNNVTLIERSAFSYCTSLSSITLPNSLITIDRSVFYACRSLNNITFEGTQAQWKAVKKGYGWDEDTGNYIIHCTDGDIQKGE